MGMIDDLRAWLADILSVERAAPGTSVGVDSVSLSGLAGGAGVDASSADYAGYYDRSVPLYAAIRLRAESVSRPHLRVYRESVVEGERRLDWVGPDHEAQTLLDDANPHWTAGDLWRATETYLNLWGAAYWYIDKEGDRPSELWPMRPDRVRIVPDQNEYIKGYVYIGASGRQTAFLPDEVLRMRYFNPTEEYVGHSPVAPARLSLDLGYDSLVGNRAGLTNDGTPGGIAIEAAVSPTASEVERIRSDWEARYRGPRNRMRPLILSDGLTVKNLGLGPREMQYITGLKWTVEDVSRAFNVPKPLLHDLDRATYSNIETARRMFWETCIVPQLRFFEEKLNETLMPMFGDPSLVAEFDLSEIEALRESENEKASRIQIYVNAGVMTVNEARAEIGLPPGGDSDGAEDGD